MDDVITLWLSLFITLTNESNNVEPGIKTSCVSYYRTFLNIASTGIMKLDIQLDNIIDNIRTEDNIWDIAGKEEE